MKPCKYLHHHALTILLSSVLTISDCDGGAHSPKTNTRRMSTNLFGSKDPAKSYKVFLTNSDSFNDFVSGDNIIQEKDCKPIPEVQSNTSQTQDKESLIPNSVETKVVEGDANPYQYTFAWDALPNDPNNGYFLDLYEENNCGGNNEDFSPQYKSGQTLRTKNVMQSYKVHLTPLTDSSSTILSTDCINFEQSIMQKVINFVCSLPIIKIVCPDTTPPVITLNGDSTITLTIGDTFTDPGATADGGETITISGTVDTDTAGTYTLTYTATDNAENKGSITRRVIVKTEKPDLPVAPN